MSLPHYLFVYCYSLMQSVNGAQFLNTTSLSLFFGPAPASGNIVPLTSIYPLLYHINLTLALI